MKTTVQLRYLRVAPRKVRLVADLVRGKHVAEAQRILAFTPKEGARHIGKLLHSGIAGAKHNHNANDAYLYISKITVDEGPKLIRYEMRARGSANQIQKKSSHITLELEDRSPVTEEPQKKEVKKKTKKDKQPVKAAAKS